MTQKYFSKLNYSMANEDTGLEYELVKRIRPKKVLSVCGSGGRALPLICGGTKELICVDLSEQQLMLLELRAECIKKLSYEDYLIFWGYAPYFIDRYTEKRQEIFNQLDLKSETKNYFADLFSKSHFKSILYEGSWESTFVFFSKIVRFFLRSHAKKVFEFTDLTAQREYFDREFPWKRWAVVLQIVGNKSMFNTFLYKGDFVKKNIDESYFEFYGQAFKRLFYNDLTRKSFFLQLCFLGEIIYQEGNTIEAGQECFDLMKETLNSPDFKLTAVKGDLISTIKNYNDIDFVSMSDVPSYFSGDVEANFLQEVKPHLSPKGVNVIRSYLRVPRADRTGYRDRAKDYQKQIDLEKVQMYNVEILENDQA